MSLSANARNRLIMAMTDPSSGAEVANALDNATEGVEANNTAVTTVGAATLTAAQIVGGVITRSGSVAAYTDTTDTATAIIAALVGAVIGQTFWLRIVNTVAFAQTLAGGTGVTLSGNTIIPPNSVGLFLVKYTAAATVTMYGVECVPITVGALLVSTARSTVGAGTITGAGIAGGVTNRTGSTAAFTDTTDTAANIIAAQPNATIGQSWAYKYFNNTAAAATLTGGTGVTVSAITIVPAGCWAEFLVTYTAAATVTMVGVASGPNCVLPAVQYTTAALSSSTAAAGQLTGANFTVMNNSGANPGNYTTRTATQMFGDIPNCQIGTTYVLRIKNGQGTGILTVAAGTGVTLTGTMTIAINTFRDFAVTFQSTTTCTLQSIGTGTDS